MMVNHKEIVILLLGLLLIKMYFVLSNLKLILMYVENIKIYVIDYFYKVYQRI